MKTTYVPDIFKKHWHAALDEYERIIAENERMKRELAEMDRKAKIALNNAYADGYAAGQADKRKAAR